MVIGISANSVTRALVMYDKDSNRQSINSSPKWFEFKVLCIVRCDTNHVLLGLALWNRFGSILSSKEMLMREC